MRLLRRRQDSGKLEISRTHQSVETVRKSESVTELIIHIERVPPFVNQKSASFRLLGFRSQLPNSAQTVGVLVKIGSEELRPCFRSSGHNFNRSR